MECILAPHLKQSSGTKPSKIVMSVQDGACPVLFSNKAVHSEFQAWTVSRDGRFQQIPTLSEEPVSLTIPEGGGAANVTALKKMLVVPGESVVSKWMLCIKSANMNQTEACCVVKDMRALSNTTEVLRKAEGRLKMF